MTEKKTIKKTLKKKASVKKNTANTSAVDKGNVAETIMGSANEIWLAGLGAFAKAQQEGAKIFNKLVDEGKGVEKVIKKSSQTATKEVKSTVGKVKGKASKSWDKLENIFESRVEKTLQKLDIPSSGEISDLLNKVESLASEVAKLTGSYVGDVKAEVKKATTKKPAVKKVAKKITKKATATTKTSKKMVKKVAKKVTKKTTAAAQTTKKLEKNVVKK